MCKYKRGDVVWALCPFSDGRGIKHRPCIVEEVQNLVTGCKYKIIECTSLKEKHANQIGIVIKEGHPEFKNLGFKEDTFITKTKAWLKQNFLKPPKGSDDKPMGFCNFMDSLSN